MDVASMAVPGYMPVVLNDYVDQTQLTNRLESSCQRLVVLSEAQNRILGFNNGEAEPGVHPSVICQAVVEMERISDKVGRIIRGNITLVGWSLLLNQLPQDDLHNEANPMIGCQNDYVDRDSLSARLQAAILRSKLFFQAQVSTVLYNSLNLQIDQQVIGKSVTELEGLVGEVEAIVRENSNGSGLKALSDCAIESIDLKQAMIEYINKNRSEFVISHEFKMSGGWLQPFSNTGFIFLTTLVIEGQDEITTVPESVALLCPAIQSLTIRNCSNLRDLGLVPLLSLHKLVLDRLPKFCSLGFFSYKLTETDIRERRMWNQMREFSIRDCPNHPLVIPGMESLNLLKVSIVNADIGIVNTMGLLACNITVQGPEELISAWRAYVAARASAIMPIGPTVTIHE